MVKLLPENSVLPPLQTARAILILKLDALGDAVLLSPFIKNLRSNCVNAKITIVAQKAAASLWDACPLVNERIYLTPDWHQEQATITRTIQSIQSAGPYDLAIVPRWEADYYGAGFLAQHSGARIRVSYSASCLERKLLADPNADQHYTHVIEDKDNWHEVERNLLLLTTLGLKADDSSITVWTSEQDNQKAAQFLANHNLISKNFVAIAPGASLPHKVWPLEQWRAFCERWLQEQPLPLVIAGAGDVDQSYAATLAALDPKRIVSGVNQFNPRETAALLQHAQFFIGADSFAKHAAAAFKIPLLEISGHPADGAETDEHHASRFGAWQTESVVVQPTTCAKPLGCIEDVSVNQVWAAAQNLMR